MSDPEKLPPETAKAAECESCGAVIPPGQRWCSAVYARPCAERQAARKLNGTGRLVPRVTPGASEIAAKVLELHAPEHSIAVGDTLILEPDSDHPADCPVCAAQPVETQPERPRPWEAPAVYPGATTALQQQLDAANERIGMLEEQLRAEQSSHRAAGDKVIELARKLGEMRSDLDLKAGIEVAHANALVRATAAFAIVNAQIEMERDRSAERQRVADENADAMRVALLKCETERDATREQLRELGRLVLGWIERPYTTRFDDMAAAARAALDGTAAQSRGDEATACAHQWVEVAGAIDEHTKSVVEHCDLCGEERTIETPREVPQPASDAVKELEAAQRGLVEAVDAADGEAVNHAAVPGHVVIPDELWSRLVAARSRLEKARGNG